MTIKSYDHKVMSNENTAEEGAGLPKETFYNLPPDKKMKIEAAAIDEFTAYSFDSASINRIVAAADIPKGSFYQYFSDKKDIYSHVILLLSAKKGAFLASVLENPQQDDFFSLMYKLYTAGLKFAQSNPKMQQITTRLMADRQHPVFIEIMQQNIEKSDQIFRQMIKQAIERGEIRTDIDIPLVAHLISSLNTSVADFYVQRVRSDIDETYLEFAEQLIEILRKGIGRTQQE